MLKFDRQGFVGGTILVTTKVVGPNPKAKKPSKFSLFTKKKEGEEAEPMEVQIPFVVSDKGKTFEFLDEDQILKDYPHLFTKA